MQTSEAEKDWLRRICGGQPVTEQKKTAPVKEAEHKPVAEKKAKGHGFGDIAGIKILHSPAGRCRQTFPIPACGRPR